MPWINLKIYQNNSVLCEVFRISLKTFKVIFLFNIEIFQTLLAFTIYIKSLVITRQYLPIITNNSNIRPEANCWIPDVTDYFSNFIYILGKILMFPSRPFTKLMDISILYVQWILKEPRQVKRALISIMENAINVTFCLKC